ncbi:MAG: hydrogenase 4 subunit B [Dactylosporangium sp.]|nr:hypothetical protein [Dactylosporangium sp.]NNJ63400.1 hydrogenase 4 subunit B [Dactylosporangium sp.]
MNTIGLALAAATGLMGLGVLIALGTGVRLRAAATGTCTALIGVAGIVAGVAALAGPTFAADLPFLIPVLGARLAVDPLGGLFTAVTGGVVTAAAIYGIGYNRGRHGQRGRAAQALTAVFAWSMIMVPCAASVTTLLATWELMALASLLLVVAEHHRRTAVAEAGRWYAAMTQLGFIALLLGLVLFAATAGGDSFDALRAADPSPARSAVIFVLVLLGFGSKAGLVPAHVWLPRAHPEAPSPVSAMLSAAMVNLGVYGVLRVGFDLAGGGTRWWWLLVLAVGAASALLGILQAAMANDLKRLLAYSTVENMGLIFIGIGAAGVLLSSGAPQLAALALAAALLHVVNHASFKSLLFFGAGSVLRATGTRDLDALGGLRARMPVTTVLFAFGAMSAAALPPSNGFGSEWLLIQALVHGIPAGGVVTAVAIPVAVAVVALTAGLAMATFVKALGVGFFARPRGDGAARATESPAPMLVGMGLAALACLATALAPATLAPALARTVGTTTGVAGDVIAGGVTVRLTATTSTMSPLVITAGLALAIAATAMGIVLVGRRVRRRRAVALWDCGGGVPTARMQSTASSFAEPLQRVFAGVLDPETGVDTASCPESRYLVTQMTYRRRLSDRVERRLYPPLATAIRWLSGIGPILANGSLHRYLAYGFVGVTGLLIVLAVC